MLKRRIPFYYLIVSSILCVAITLFSKDLALHSNANSDQDKRDPVLGTQYSIKRLVVDDLNYISPILSVEPQNESDKFRRLKEDIQSYIDQQKQSGFLTSASVYVRNFSTAEWMSINADERYDPGSLLKVGVMMIYYKMAEKDTSLLNKQVVYHGQKGFKFPVEHFRSDTVVEGQKYKIDELIQRMIRYSDNRATVYLEDHMDTAGFKKEFNDLGITEPVFNTSNYRLNVKEYTMMLKALYNAALLRKSASNNALSLLTKCIFKDGLLKELPSSVVVAHKYGEAGDNVSHELHEAGIIYLQNDPYLLSVMTRGTDWNKLSEVLGHVSRMTYDYMIRW